MAVSFERNNVGINHDVLKVQIETADYLPIYHKKLKDITKKIEIKGFRKGMVPISYVQKVHGQSIFSENLIDILNENLRNYLNDIDIILSPIGIQDEQLKINVNNPENYTFSFDIALRPAINIQLADLKITEYTIEVEEKNIEDEIAKIKKQYTIEKEVEKPLADTDLIEITLEEVNDLNEKVDSENALKGSRTFALNEFSPYFQEQLKNIEDKNTAIFFEKLEVVFSDKLEDILTALQFSPAASSTKFQIRIKKLYQLEIPKMDEAFFSKKDIGGKVTNETELRNFIKEMIELQHKKIAQNYMHEQIYHALMDNAKIDISAYFIEKYLIEYNNENYTIKTEEEKKEYIKKFLKDYSWVLVYKKYEQEFDINVTKEDIIQGFSQKLHAYVGYNPTYQGYYDQMVEHFMQNKEEVEKEREDIFFDKLFTVLEGHVQKIPASISYEAFVEKTKNHHH